MPPFRLHVLGWPRVTGAAGDEIGLPVGKPMAALVRVALDDSGVTREDLAHILWPVSSRDRARASVRQAIWTLRNHLGVEAITDAPDGTLAVNARIVEIDLPLLEKALDVSDLEAIVELWSGGPLCGFVVPDAPAWNRWASEVHAAWEVRVGGLMEGQAEALPANERVRWTGQALGVRPYSEAVNVLHARALLELGRLDEAERAIADAFDRLEGGRPDVLRAVESELEMALRLRYSAETDSPVRPIFVGRSAEFGALSDALREARGGRARRVAILGPPGIGKTRLVSEFLIFARATGVQVVEARATPGERALQYGTVAEVTRQLVRLPGGAGISNASAEALRSIVPSSGNGSVLSGPISAATIGDALTDLLEAISEEGPLVVFVDDLQWADDASRTLLQRALRLVARRPVLLVETCRTEGEGARTARSLERDAESGLLSVVALPPLTADDLTQLLIELAAFSSENAAAEAGERLYRASRGSPLHMVELVHALREERVLERAPDRWTLDADRMSAVLQGPLGLEELLLRRLAGVSEDARVLLGRLARASGSGIEALRRSTDLAEGRFEEVVSELFRVDLIDWVEGRRIDFSHDLVRESVLSSMRPKQRGRRWIWATAAGLALAAGLTGYAVSAGSDPGPFDGTELTLRSDRAIYTYRPRADGSWEISDSFVTESGELDFVQPYYRGPDGRTVIGQLRPPDRGPDIVAISADGTVQLLLDGGGDDGLQGLSPDGSLLLTTVEDEAADSYRLDLETFDLESGERRVLLSPDYRALAEWSPEGRTIFAGVSTLAGDDHVLRMRPDGSELDRFAMPPGHIGGIRACGAYRTLVNLQEPRALPRWWLLDWSIRDMRPLPAELMHSTNPACSPDASYLVVVDTEARVLRAFSLADANQSMVMPLKPAPPDGTGRIAIRLSEVSTPVTVVGFAPASLRWGGQAPLRADVWDRAGRHTRGETEWIPLDPDILSVRGDSVIGNRPGTGRVVVAVDGWIKDTVTVVVTDEEVDDLLFAEAFDRFYPEVWDIEGLPGPTVVQTLDGPALSAGGDAVWVDGLQSRESFPSARGLTAEVEFKLPLTDRPDRQSIEVCLIRMLPEAGSVQGGAPGDGRFCTRYPQGELDRFDRKAIAMRVGSAQVMGFPADELLSDAYVSVGVQLRPDGRFSAIANGSEVGVFPRAVELASEDRFRLAIYGRAEGTDLLIRSVTVWRGARY